MTYVDRVKMTNFLVAVCIVFGCFYMVAVVKSVKPNGPYIVEQSVVHPTNCQDQDPLMPVCTMVHVVMENPLFVPVVASIRCGEDEADVNLSPRTRLTVDVEMTLYVSDVNCEILKWRK